MTAPPGATTARRCCVPPGVAECGVGTGYRVYAPGLPAAGAVRDPLHLPQKALAQAAEAKQAFTILQREHEPDADRWLQEAEQLLYALTHEPPTAPAAYNIESLQLD